MNRLEKTCLSGLLALPIGVGLIALEFLNTPPSISCDYVDQHAAASVRLHCAQQRAQRGTPESLAAAIELLQSVPADDPYRQQSNQLIQRWSSELLATAEREVQAGNLDKGISMMQPLAQEAKVRSWRLLWHKGESLMKTALEQTEKRQWQQAFQTAGQLRQFENEYWANEQYNSLLRQIQSDREFRDWTLRNPVEPDKNPKDIDLPKLPKTARSTRPLWKIQDDVPVSTRAVKSQNDPPSHSVSNEQPKPDEPSSHPPLPVLEPEPPVEIVQPPAPKVEIPVPEPEK